MIEYFEKYEIKTNLKNILNDFENKVKIKKYIYDMTPKAPL